MSVSRLEADLALKTCASKFLEIYSTKLYELVTISPEIIQSIELIESEWGVPGFKILLYYTIGNNSIQLQLHSLPFIITTSLNTLFLRMYALYIVELGSWN